MIQHRGRGGTVSEIVDCPMPTAPARAYAIKAREDQDAPEVIAGIFSLYDIEMHVALLIRIFVPNMFLIECHQ